MFVAASTGVETELFSLKGNDGTVVEYTENKENRKGYVNYLDKASPLCMLASDFCCMAPDKAAYCVLTQLLGPKNAIKLFSVRTKTQ